MTNSRSYFGTMAATIMAGACVALTAQGADTLRYQGKPGSKVEVAGTSSIHPWTLKSGVVRGSFEVPTGVVLDSAQAAPAGVKGKIEAKTDVLIPENQLHGDYQGMDGVISDAMNTDKYPFIQFRLTEMTAKDGHAANTPLQFDTKGDLSLNGVTNKISMAVTIETVEKNKLKIIGSTPLKMTDFKVKPPAPKVGLGLLTTGDDVKVSFEWIVALVEKAP